MRLILLLAHDAIWQRHSKNKKLMQIFIMAEFAWLMTPGFQLWVGIYFADYLRDENIYLSNINIMMQECHKKLRILVHFEIYKHSFAVKKPSRGGSTYYKLHNEEIILNYLINKRLFRILIINLFMIEQ